jgi:sigma-B regulation protein RsbU (phosphoserine phosphatase)
MDMTPIEVNSIRYQLEEKRNKLQETIQDFKNPTELLNLLNEVDSALERMNHGTYGLCEVCHDPIEDYRLKQDPLMSFCLDHLTSSQQRALEQDLKLAAQIQNALLPKNNTIIDGWEFSYHYEPAELVSGDYCDLVSSENIFKKQLFIIGDVSGKGVAASMLMSHLHAMFHSLTSLNLEIRDLVERANRLFCESTLSTHYSTLVFVLAHDSGEIEICNAGHCAPILIKENQVTKIDATGIPIGLFCSGEFGVNKYKLESGDTILLYTDGLSEALNNDEEYGEERILKLAESLMSVSPQKMITVFLEDLNLFLSGKLKSDNLTLMAVRRL